MNFRVIPLDFPQGTIPMMQRCPTMNRPHDTEVRGMYAFVGNGRVWAIAELLDVKPIVWKAPKAGEEPEKPVGSDGWLWRFSPLQRIEGIDCPEYKEPAFVKSGDGWEPQHLNATIQKHLREFLGIDEFATAPQEVIAEAEAATHLGGRGPKAGICSTCDEPCGDEYNLAMCPDQYPDGADEDSEDWSKWPICAECWEHHKLAMPDAPEVEPVAAPITSRSITLGVRPVEAPENLPAPPKRASKPRKPKLTTSQAETYEANMKGQLAMF